MRLFRARGERRSSERLRLAFPVLIEGPYGLRRCVARDVSERGLFVETNEIFPLGTELRVTFSLPDGSWEMTARCTVKHVMKLSGLGGSLHGMGLALGAIEDDVAGPPGVRPLHA